jgi:hypothetical protein
MTDVFTFRLLELNCGCGVRGECYKGIAITHDFELAIFWSCPKCDKEVYAKVPLELMAKMKPEPPVAEVVTLGDRHMLENHHISWE